MVKQLISKTQQLAFKTKNVIVKHSPEILLGLGAVATVGSIVTACVATTKLSSVIEEKATTKARIDEVFADPTRPEVLAIYPDPEKGLIQEKIIMYRDFLFGLGRLYLPSIGLLALGLTCFAGSHHILKKRNAALAAAYMTLDQGFKDYRKRVVAKYGEEEDLALFHGTIKDKITRTITDPITGEKKTITEEIDVRETVNGSVYSRNFNRDTSDDWSVYMDDNAVFIKTRERYANDKLAMKGQLFLNEVYDMFGLERSRAGQSVGWVYNPNHPLHQIQIRAIDIYDKPLTREYDLINELEWQHNVVLDFNVEGLVVDRLKEF